MNRTLLVTNDFPPRPGGIQTFVHRLAGYQPPGSLVVYVSSWPRGKPEVAVRFDAEQPYEVVRDPTTVLLPTPGVAARVARLARDRGCDTVWFGAAAPLGLLAAGLRRRGGIGWALAQTHGHEAGWAALPGARGLLGRVGAHVDVVTYLGEYFRSRLVPVLSRRTRLARLAPGVDIEAYHPDRDGSAVRRRHRLGDRPVVVCVSRLVARKGQDALIRALPAVRSRIDGAALLIVGGGPDRSRLRRLADRVGVGPHVVFAGSVPWAELPEHYAAGDVFAMPCRTRRGGLDVEGLGIVYLEASASGLPVLAGDSGGAPDAVLPERSGYVVGGRDLAAITDRLCALLADRQLAARMGAAGRAWVEQEWRWDLQAARMARLLAGPGGPADPATRASADGG